MLVTLVLKLREIYQLINSSLASMPGVTLFAWTGCEGLKIINSDVVSLVNPTWTLYSFPSTP